MRVLGMLLLAILSLPSCEEVVNNEITGIVVFRSAYMSFSQEYNFTQTFENDSFYLLTYKGQQMRKNPEMDSSKIYHLPIDRFELVADTSISPQLWKAPLMDIPLWVDGYREYNIYNKKLEVYKYTCSESSGGRNISYYHLFWCPSYGIIMRGYGPTGLHSSDPHTLSSPIYSEDTARVRKLIELIYKDKDFMYYKGSETVFEVKKTRRDTLKYDSYRSPKPDNPSRFDEYQEYITENTRYPDSALSSCHYGTLWYKVFLEKPDSVKSVYSMPRKIFGEYFPIFDRECRRVLNSIPGFQSVRYQGRPIRSNYSFRFDFELPNYEKCKDSLDARAARAKNTRERSLYTIVEQMPVFESTDMSLTDYINANIVYPEKAKDEGVSAQVFLIFIVSDDGEIVRPEILRCKAQRYCKEFEEAALNLVTNMPKWNPGKQRGKEVNVQYNLQVEFKP
ncbi:MAG: energy transducer TonB [Flavobacteriales bacterium]|nr:energy transducer TonB [Flavobacteriales bacterium]